MQYLDTYVGISLDEIVSLANEHELGAKGLIPFAKDIEGGSVQCVKAEGNTVVNYELDEKVESED